MESNTASFETCPPARESEDQSASIQDAGSEGSASYTEYDEDDPLFWDPEVEALEDSFVLEEARKRLPRVPIQVRPSQFVHMAFRMPKETGFGYEKFSFDGRRHIIRPYDTDAPRVLLVCARQVEKSTCIGNSLLTHCCLVPSYKALYVSPSAMQSKTFSNDRVKEPIETSPILKAYTTTTLSQNVFEKQFVNRSKITIRYAFLNADRTRGIPAWKIAIDEIQDILAENIPVIERCSDHAPRRWRSFLYSGTPKSLDNTIEWYRSNKSTQGEWVVPCDCLGGEGGRYWNILGEKNIGQKYLICEKCGKQLHPMGDDSQWAHQVAFDPDKMFESFRISQLMVPWKKWSDILYDYETMPRAQFYNEVLGISFDSGLRPLTLAQLKESCSPQVTMHPSVLDHYRQLGHSQPIFMGIDWGCHDDQTRILTDAGFKYFLDLTDDDKVAQWDPDTREMTFVKPMVRTVRDWSAPLLHFETDGALDLMVTHTHRMRTTVAHRDSWVTESAGETADRGGNVRFVGHVEWRGRERRTFVLPGLPVSPGYSGSKDRTFRMDDWIEFVGYLVTEAGVCFDGGRPSCIKMSQRTPVNQGNVDRIKGCLAALNIEYSEFPNSETGDLNWTIYGKQYWQWYIDNIGVECDEKRLPRELLDLSRKQLRILFDALVDGDGSRDDRYDEESGAFYSTSKGLCEDFQEICIRLGMRCVVRLHKEAEGNHKTRWRALWSRGRDYTFNTPSAKVKRVPYSGKVYCCAVPTGYIVTERNGCVSYQGNTGENTYTVVTLATYVDMKFRVFYVHRCVGDLIDPQPQLDFICGLVSRFNVRVIGTDYGGGFDRNDHLMRKFGAQRLVKFQYMSRCKKKVEWDPRLLRYKAHRTEVMSDVFNAIKRRQFEFPRWEEFHADGKAPFATDMLNIFSQYNDTLKMIQYLHAPDKPDDTFHSLLYCFLGSMIVFPRPDVIAPRRELPGRGPIYQGSWSPLDQG